MKPNLSRKRSVTLDAVKFQELAKEKRYNLASLEAEMIEIGGFSKGTAAKLWKGKKADIGETRRVVNLLGMSDLDSLLPDICSDIVFPEKQIWDKNKTTPGSLLQAEYRIVPFHQRFEELEELDAWCRNDNELSIRLYTGAGGMGKTRLAIEQCIRLQNDNWVSGFLRMSSSKQFAEDRFRSFKTMTQDVFIVVDYAETRREELIGLLKSGLQANCKLRVILLARAAADWWNILKTERDGVGSLLASPSSSWVTLQPLSLKRKQREESYCLAAESFGNVLKKDPPLFAPDNLEADYFERALLLHMQALIDVEERQQPREQKDIQGILSAIINRERRFWREQASKRKLPEGLHDSIGEVMARITMIGGVKDKKQAIDILNAVPLVSAAQEHERATVLKLLHDLYPCNQASQEAFGYNYIEPLQPDLLGEHLMQEELEKNAEGILADIFG